MMDGESQAFSRSQSFPYSYPLSFSFLPKFCVSTIQPKQHRNNNVSLLIQLKQLSLIHMSDQYTRITTGGSPLPKTAPIVGYLFGYQSFGPSGGKRLEIIDADEIAIDRSESSEKQIELHQAVFPQHHVVGWYRVSTTDSEPTADDLATTLQLKQFHHQKIGTKDEGIDQPWVFCFCPVEKKNDVMETNNDAEDEQPVLLYQLFQEEDGQNPILLSLEGQWKLQTSESEKIAIEAILRQQSSNSSSVSSMYVSHVSSLEVAILQMKERLDVMIHFLQGTHQGTIPLDPILMRQVQSVVLQLGAIGAQSPASASGMELTWLSQVAVAAKTVQAIHSYTGKLQAVQDHVVGYGRMGGPNSLRF
jgi:Maintenance of mitochondrial structure and function